MGVWIEIPEGGSTSLTVNVTPFMGVWIEIARLGVTATMLCSHSLHGSVD